MHFDVVVIAANFVIGFLNSTAGFLITESEASLSNHFFAIQPVLWLYLYSMELLHERVFGSDLSISEVCNPADWATASCHHLGLNWLIDQVSESFWDQPIDFDHSPTKDFPSDYIDF